jgi:hypothetical protein
MSVNKSMGWRIRVPAIAARAEVEGFGRAFRANRMTSDIPSQEGMRGRVRDENAGVRITGGWM